MDLSVIVLTYNSQDGVKQSLDQLIKYLPPKTEVIVVDNQSSDQTPQILESFPKIKYIPSKTLMARFTLLHQLNYL